MLERYQQTLPHTARSGSTRSLARLFGIVYVLWESPAGISQKAIAEQAWLPKQTVSAKVPGLIEEGIAELSKNPADGHSNLAPSPPRATAASNPRRTD